ncbi:MAG: Gfo/Idh/MocA family oxidoreductase [Bacteroidota bacterium]
MKSCKIGIIGFGGFGKFLYNSWSKLENVNIIAIADLDAEKAKGGDNIEAFTNWRELLKIKDIDLIAIVTTPDQHQEMAIACMEAGKHVLIEKPLATSLPDAEEIIQARDRTHRVAGIDFMMRFNPMLQSLQQFTQNGTFGKLRRVDVENYAQDESLPISHWFWNPDRSGGILVEHGVHFIDLVHFLSPSKPVFVSGLRYKRNSQQEDQFMANVVYRDGLMATHYHSFSRPGFFENTKIKLAFDLADLELHGWMPLWADVRVLVNPETKSTLLNDPLFEMSASIPLSQLEDESRPKGWGVTENNRSDDGHRIRSGGITYQGTEMVVGKFLTRRLKQEVYVNCVQASLLDLIKKIADPSHKLTASLETGLASLEIAIQATKSARGI